MTPPCTLTTAQILGVFTDEIAARGGRIIDTFHDGERLFTRSVLAHVLEVRPGDRVQGGVALRAARGGVYLNPYTFRVVCRNGAIVVTRVAEYALGDLGEREPEMAIQYVREGIAACCAPGVFPELVRKMRKASNTQVDQLRTLLPLLVSLSEAVGAEPAGQILDRFLRGGDETQFGLANAVTAVARDTQDPDVRWNLEGLGGGIAVAAFPDHPVGGEVLAMFRSPVAIGVGRDRRGLWSSWTGAVMALAGATDAPRVPAAQREP